MLATVFSGAQCYQQITGPGVQLQYHRDASTPLCHTVLIWRVEPLLYGTVPGVAMGAFTLSAVCLEVPRYRANGQPGHAHGTFGTDK